MAANSVPHPILDVDQKLTFDKQNMEFWSNEIKQRDKKNENMQKSLWVALGFAAVLVVAVVVLAFGRKEFHYRDVTDALGNSWQFGIRSVDAHDQYAVKLLLERYVKGVRLVTKDAEMQYRETNWAWKRSRIKAQNSITNNFASEGKPEELSARDVSRSVVEGTVEIAIQTGNHFSARWMEEKRDPTTGNERSQYAGSGTLELQDPSKVKGWEKEAAPDGVWVNEFSFSQLR